MRRVAQVGEVSHGGGLVRGRVGGEHLIVEGGRDLPDRQQPYLGGAFHLPRLDVLGHRVRRDAQLLQRGRRLGRVDLLGQVRRRDPVYRRRQTLVCPLVVRELQLRVRLRRRVTQVLHEPGSGGCVNLFRLIHGQHGGQRQLFLGGSLRVGGVHDVRLGQLGSQPLLLEQG